MNNVFRPMSGSLDMCVNNIKIFINSINDGGQMNVFYLFVGTSRASPFLLPLERHNVVFFQLGMDDESFEHHLRLPESLDQTTLTGFETTFFLSSNSRGPFLHGANGDWLGDFQYLMDRNNVGLVGSTLTCETAAPSVQVEAFAIRSTLL
jgi:hypothetical protein